MQRTKFGGGYDELNCVNTQDVKGWKESIEEEKICMCWVNTSLKMTYLTTLYLSHTLQVTEDIFDLKSCELRMVCLASLWSLTHS